MNSANIRKMRLPVELRNLQKTQSNHGITCTTPKTENSADFSELLAIIPGPKGSPYEAGKFEVSITIGTQYPFQPPTFKFLTPVYHPNIDSAGKICLDLLRMPPTGSYSPANTLESLLLSIQLLLATPNPEDPLEADAAHLYKTNREEFCKKAQQFVQKHCVSRPYENSEQINQVTQESEDKETEKSAVPTKRLKLERTNCT